MSKKQHLLSELIGEIEWEDAEIGMHLLPEIVGIPPDRALVRSIEEAGVLVPVLLTGSLLGDSGASQTYRVIDGNRRIAAAREVGLTSIPARVASGEHAANAGYAFTLITNDHRSANPVAEWDAIQALRKSWGMNESGIAHILGISVATVKKRERLSNLRPFWERRFRAGELSASIAEAIAKLPEKDQERLVKAMSGKEGAKRVTHEMIREVKEARNAAYSSPLIPQPVPEPGSRAEAEMEERDEGARILALVNKARGEVVSGGDDLAVRLDRVLADLESIGIRMGGMR